MTFLLVLLSSIFFYFIPFVCRSEISSAANAEVVTGSSEYIASTLRRYDDYGDSYFCIYSNKMVEKSSTEYDVEHIYARSWVSQAPEALKAMVANDAFNVRVSDKNTNSKRGNAYFSYVNKSTARVIYDANNYISGWLDVSNNLFEPNDETKGDIARAILYMVIKYDLDYPRLFIMISWSKLDPPDEYERDHFQKAFALCGYSNILITNPSLSIYCLP